MPVPRAVGQHRLTNDTPIVRTEHLELELYFVFCTVRAVRQDSNTKTISLLAAQQAATANEYLYYLFRYTVPVCNSHQAYMTYRVDGCWVWSSG